MKTYHRENNRNEYKVLQKRVSPSQMLKSQHTIIVSQILSSIQTIKSRFGNTDKNQETRKCAWASVYSYTLKFTDEKAISYQCIYKANILNYISNQC